MKSAAENCHFEATTPQNSMELNDSSNKLREAYKKLQKKSRLFPKKRNYVTFVAKTSYGLIDNVKYAYLYCKQHCANVFTSRVIYPFRKYSDEDIMFMLQSAFMVSDCNSWKKDLILFNILSPTTKIQLWHGVPLKKLSVHVYELECHPVVENNAFSYACVAWDFCGYHYAVCSSDFLAETIFKQVFPGAECVVLGYPRIDVLGRDLNKDDLINVDIGAYNALKKARSNGLRVVLYAPTFRDGGGDPISDSAIRLAEMNAFCKTNYIVFVLKFHPWVRGLENHVKHQGYENILVVKSDTDVYPLLPLTDALVTDYSSIFFDYLMLDKPIIYYPYDFDRYVCRDRELYFEYNNTYAPGPKVYSQDDLACVLGEIVVQGGDDYKIVRDNLKVLMFKHNDFRSSERFGHFMSLKVLSEAEPGSIQKRHS